MLNFLRTNMAWMLVAIAMSTTLWATVASQQNPDVSSVVSGLAVELRDKPAGLVATSPVLPVSVDIKAPLDLSQKLLPTAFKAYIDLSNASSGFQEYSVVVTSNDRRIRIDAVNPDKVTVRLESIKKKDVSVRVNVVDTPPFGFAAKQARVTPDQITVSGPESQVEQVIAASVEVRLDNVRSSVRQPVKPIPQDASGEPVRDVTTGPESVLVEVPIEQQVSYKALPVAPQLAGSVALGYQIVGIMVEPTIVTVVGDPAVLQETPFLSTKAIDVSGSTTDKVTSADLVLPTGVSLVRAQPIDVRVYVSPVEANKVVRVVPQLKGANASRVDLSPSTVDVTVSGPMPLLATLRPQEVQASIDLSGSISGTRSITVTATVPSPLRVDDVSPKQVAVTVRPP